VPVDCLPLPSVDSLKATVFEVPSVSLRKFTLEPS
jgi:hypothetical protein